MKLQKLSENCIAFLNTKNRLCDANSGLIAKGGGLLVDTQSDLAHASDLARHCRDLIGANPKFVVNTHEDLDHVWGNQLFRDAEIIAHRSVPERIGEIANPAPIQKLLKAASNWLGRIVLSVTHPGVLVAGKQLLEDYNFQGIDLTVPNTVFDKAYEVDLDGLNVQLLYVGPSHQMGDTMAYVADEGVLFAGDVVFNECTPIGWCGTFANWFTCLETIAELDPNQIVPGHGPVCGLEQVALLNDYLQLVYESARVSFDQGQSEMEAACRIDIGHFESWHAPARIYMSVARAYREFRGEPEDKPWSIPNCMDAMYRVMKKRGLKVEF